MDRISKPALIVPRTPHYQSAGAGPSLRITRGNFFTADSLTASFSGVVPLGTSESSPSSDEDDVNSVVVLGRPRAALALRGAACFPDDTDGLDRPLLFPFAGLRSRSVLSEAGTGARGCAGRVCDESMEAKTSMVRASHGAGGVFCDGRPPRRFFVAASSYYQKFLSYAMVTKATGAGETHSSEVL